MDAMGSRIGRHFRANAVAYLALFIALGGSAYAASHINGKTIKKDSIPGNRLKKNSVTGRQVRESSLGTVPTAANANEATTATTANTAKNANALGGMGVAAFGPGVINGGIDSAQNGGNFRTPYGVTTYNAPGAGLEAIAPVDLTLRTFEAQWITNFDSDDTLAFAVQINNGSSLKSVPLCTIVGTAAGFDCRTAGPVSIARGDLYKLDLTGTGLEGNEQATFAYRLAAG
jgi:hypothetical protein